MVPIPRNVVTKKAAGGLGRRQLLTQPEIVIPLPRDFGFYALFADLPRTDWARALLCFPQSPIFPSQLPPCRLIEPFPEWHLFRSIPPRLISCSVFFCLFLLSLELRSRWSSDLFLSSRPRTGLATTYITGYG